MNYDQFLLEIECAKHLVEDGEDGICERLDEVVHDMKAAEAADINNGGLDSQVQYLVESYNHDYDKVMEFLRKEGVV